MPSTRAASAISGFGLLPLICLIFFPQLPIRVITSNKKCRPGKQIASSVRKHDDVILTLEPDMYSFFISLDGYPNFKPISVRMFNKRTRPPYPFASPQIRYTFRFLAAF